MHTEKVLTPKHIAIIPDGNRRWAKKKGYPIEFGHQEGAKNIFNVVRLAKSKKIKTITFYLFSTENWHRSIFEVQTLMNLFDSYLRERTPEMIQEGVMLETIGDLKKLPFFLQKTIQECKKITKDNKNIQLVLALNYGGRDEIKRAFCSLLEDITQKKINPETITEDLISSYLDTAPFGDPDLIIRTSGENRMSNFLLWQTSYSEVWLDEVLWPDFCESHFSAALQGYQQRIRRHGGA